MVWLLLIALLALTGLVGVRWSRKDSIQNTALFGGLIALIALTYAVGVLHWAVAGTGVTVKEAEQLRADLYATKEDVAKLASLALQSAFVVADGASRVGGTPEEHMEQLKGYVRQWEELTHVPVGQLQAQMDATVKGLNRAINEKSRKEFEEKWRSLPMCGEPVVPPCAGRNAEGKRFYHDGKSIMTLNE